jgi:hypothetical protein
VSVRATRVDCGVLQTTCSVLFTRPTPIAEQPTINIPTICEGGSQTCTVVGKNVTTMTWTPPSGFSISNVSNVTNGADITSTATIVANTFGAEASGNISVTPSSSSCGNGTSINIPIRSVGGIPSSSLISVSGAGMTVTQSGLNLAAIYNNAFISSSSNSENIVAVQWQSSSSSVYVVTSGTTATAYPTNGCVGGTATLLVRVSRCSSNNWSGWRTFTVNVCSGSGFRFAFGPNPTSSTLEVKAEPTEENKDFKIAKDIDFEVKLLDKDGKAVREGKNQNKEKKLTFDVKGLKEGTYYLHIAYGKEVEKHQIVVGKSAIGN